MEKIMNLWNYSIDAINKELEDGWTVKMIVPYNQYVACSGSVTMNKEGIYGAFVVLEKLDIMSGPTRYQPPIND